MAANGVSSPFKGFATDLIHRGQDPEQWDAHQVIPVISTSTTYKQSAPAKYKTYDYGRSGNPTRTVLEQCLAATENAQYCSVFSSGLSAVNALTNLLKQGDHIACCDDVYGGTQRFFRKTAINSGIETDMVNMSCEETIRKTMRPNTKMVWLETPTNPLLTVLDIARTVDVVKKIDANILVIVDNTFMTPYFQRPLDLGADVVVHSITKYLNGHTDVVMGCCMTNNEEVGKKLSYLQLAMGAVPSPFDCYLVNRGLKTLHVRMRAHNQNGLAVARHLEANPRVQKVLYPELPSHPQHAIHAKQTRGMSGMVSFYLRGGLEESEKFLSALKVFILAESLGGFESLAELPSVMTHASVPAEERAKLGITDNLIRLSVGIEDCDDLIADLDQALQLAVPDA